MRSSRQTSSLPRRRRGRRQMLEAAEADLALEVGFVHVKAPQAFPEIARQVRRREQTAFRASRWRRRSCRALPDAPASRAASGERLSCRPLNNINVVKLLAGFGMPQEQICLLVINRQTGEPLEAKSLRKHFKRGI